MADVGIGVNSEVTIIVGRWRGLLGTVERETKLSVVVKVQNSLVPVTIRKTSVRAMTPEEAEDFAVRNQDLSPEEEVEEMKVLGRLVARRLMGQRDRAKRMYRVFWDEMQKKLGPDE